MKNLDQVINKLPAARRIKIEGRARELIGQEMALQQLRKARQRFGKQMSKIGPVGMKDWNDEQQCWIGTIVEADEEACEITVLDVGSAATQVEIDDWIRRALKERRWA